MSLSKPTTPDSSPEEVWPPARKAARRVLDPIERFLHVEASSGIVLAAAAAIALVWANSSWHASYQALWHMPVGLRLGETTIEHDLHFWVNDGLMVLFFFVVGLEMRREMVQGELSRWDRALLPFLGALGGMLVPAVAFLVLNRGEAGQDGWGIPMATDIAFAVGALALLGSRVPPALRVLLLAVAVIDDIGAILVIAIFYSSGVSVDGLVIMAGAVGSVLVLQRVGVRHPLGYVPSGLLAWYGALHAGVHPTLAGVLMGLLTPARAWLGQGGFVDSTERALEQIREPDGPDDEEELLEQVQELNQAQREAVSPALRLHSLLHPWVAFLIMPIFALANAGVRIDGLDLSSSGGMSLAVGIVVGLMVGKPLGIFAFTALGVRLGWCTLPSGVTNRGVLTVGFVGGIGFTMSLFIGGLAFQDPVLLGAAKAAILCGSAGALVLGLAMGLGLSKQPVEGAALTAAEAERSTAA